VNRYDFVKADHRRLLVLVSLGGFGCSFVFVPPPPSDPMERTREAASRCTTSVLHPVLDSVAAGVGALNFGIAADASPGKVAWYSIEMDAKKGMALGATQLALYGAAAVYGFVQTSRCSDLRDEVRGKPEGPTWSPALAPPRAAPPIPTTEPSPSPTMTAMPPVSAPVPAPAPTTARPPPPAPTTASSSAPPAPSSKPSVPTVSFPDD
jgi:hypothetical protein